MARRARRGRSASHRRGRDTGKTFLGIILIALVLAAVGGGGFLYVRATENKVELDQTTLCPVRDGQIRPVGYAAILIDTSDELPAIQRTNAANELVDVVNGVPQGWRLSIYQVATEVAQLPKASIILCNPGSGEELKSYIGKS
jgi:hypothetical protein